MATRISCAMISGFSGRSQWRVSTLWLFVYPRSIDARMLFAAYRQISGAILNSRSSSDDTCFCTFDRGHGTSGRGGRGRLVRVVCDRDRSTRSWRLRNRYKNAFSQIDVQLKRRYDLIPNLVEVAKGYMSHERETLEAVIHARNQAVTAQQKATSSPGDPAAMTSLGAAEGQVAGRSAGYSHLPRAIPI